MIHSSLFQLTLLLTLFHYSTHSGFFTGVFSFINFPYCSSLLKFQTPTSIRAPPTTKGLKSGVAHIQYLPLMPSTRMCFSHNVTRVCIKTILINYVHLKFLWQSLFWFLVEVLFWLPQKPKKVVRLRLLIVHALSIHYLILKHCK